MCESHLLPVRACPAGGMHMYKSNIGPSEKLRAEFTSWLTTLMRRARIDYFRSKEREVKTISLDEVSETDFAVQDKYTILESSFQFEEERLARAFFSLPLQRQQILTMLYVDELPPEEIARLLHCSVDNIYKTRRRTLNSLRKMLDELEGTT